MSTYVGIDAEVALYKAVEVQNQKLCHTGNFIAYKGEDEEVRLEVHSYIFSLQFLSNIIR